MASLPPMTPLPAPHWLASPEASPLEKALWSPETTSLRPLTSPRTFPRALFTSITGGPPTPPCDRARGFRSVQFYYNFMLTRLHNQVLESRARDPPAYGIPMHDLGVEMDPTDSKYFVAGSDGSVYNGALKGKQGQKLVAWGRKIVGQSLPCRNKMRRAVRKVMEVDEVLGVLEEGGCQAIETVGSATETCEKFLELFLKEVKFGNNCASDDNEEVDDI
ncbi:hypothetical protein Acr_00g0069880 [Actinidia rufa]|uniref:Uncharacterized protein n=1 Tax=Actinidia rufa TaxID=165716 RepID=A0A7J0DRM9_9ERIC|nr:hypothetical protein Acr_00g0069880 [Actinidia rufa]